MWTLILINLLFPLYDSTLTGVNPQFYTIPYDAALKPSINGSSGTETLYLIQPSYHQYVTSTAGFERNHSVSLASMSLAMHSHVIKAVGSKIENSFAICSVDNGRILAEHGANIRCNVQGLLSKDSKEKLFEFSCEIYLAKSSDCVVNLDFSSIGMSETALLEIHFKYVASVVDSQGKINTELAGLLLYNEMFVPPVNLLRIPEIIELNLPNNIGLITVITLTQNSHFAVNLSLSRSINTANIHLQIQGPLRLLTQTYSKSSHWTLEFQQMELSDVLLVIHNNRDSYSRMDPQFDHVDILNFKLNDQPNTWSSPFQRRSRVELRITNFTFTNGSQNSVSQVPILVPIPRLIPTDRDMRIFTIFQSSDIIQPSWLPGTKYPPPRMLRVLGYIPAERRIVDLTEKVYCRSASQPLGIREPQVSQATCPFNMKNADESLERLKPSGIIHGMKMKPSAFGTGLKQPDQLVLGLKNEKFKYRIVPDWLFDQDPDQSDFGTPFLDSIWVWRTWKGPSHRVWFISNSQIVTTKPKLRKIDSWWYKDPDSNACIPRYEQTAIKIIGSLYTKSNGERIYFPDTEKGGRLILDFTRLLSKQTLTLVSSDNLGAQAAKIVWHGNEGPFLVGLRRGVVSVMFQSLDIKSLPIEVSDETVFVDRMIAECLDENVTISGDMENYYLTKSLFKTMDFDFPTLLKLQLKANNYLNQSLVSTTRNNSLMNFLQANSNLMRPSPIAADSLSCPLNMVAVTFVLSGSENEILELYKLEPNVIRLQVSFDDKNKASWIIWDPSNRPEVSSPLPKVRISSITAWSSHQTCTEAYLPTSRISAPIVAMDDAYSIARFEGSWSPIPSDTLTNISLLVSQESTSSSRYYIIFAVTCTVALFLIIVQCSIVIAIKQRCFISKRARRNRMNDQMFKSMGPLSLNHPAGNDLCNPHGHNPCLLKSGLSSPISGGLNGFCGGLHQSNGSLARQSCCNHSPQPMHQTATPVIISSKGLYGSPGHSPVTSLNWKPPNLQTAALMNNSPGMVMYSSHSRCYSNGGSDHQISPMSFYQDHGGSSPAASTSPRNHLGTQRSSGFDFDVVYTQRKNLNLSSSNTPPPSDQYWQNSNSTQRLISFTNRLGQKSPLEEQTGYTSGLGSAVTTTCCEVCSDEGVASGMETASSSNNAVPTMELSTFKIPPPMPPANPENPLGLIFPLLPNSESSDVLVSMMGALEDELDFEDSLPRHQNKNFQIREILPPPNF